MIRIALIALGTLGIGGLISKKLLNRKLRVKNKEKVHSKDINNIIKGIGKKEDLAILYKSLVKRVHPDKNQDNLELAEKFTTLINKNRRNYQELLSLENEINLTFKTNSQC